MGYESGLAWLHYRGGAVYVKNPDQEFLAKLLLIAADFDAVVVGDVGEVYENPDDHGVLPAASRAMQPNLRPWWKFWCLF